MGQLLDSLPPEQRLAHYREFAEAALRQAALTTDQVIRADLLSMAAGWHLLIGELEKAQSHPAPADGMPQSPKAPARH